MSKCGAAREAAVQFGAASHLGSRALVADPTLQIVLLRLAALRDKGSSKTCTRWYQAAPYGSKWYHMMSAGISRYHMVPGGINQYHMVLKWYHMMSAGKS
uniref:Uncharacterized protein n=1 Tax=Oryza brachyantha TaxID=4533 RepID=J3LVM5_ORYBR